jgi:hypothetical protein
MMVGDCKISGGGSFEIQDLNLRLQSLIANRANFIKNPFSATLECFLTAEDILHSAIIRELSELLIIKIITKRIPQFKTFSGVQVQNVELKNKNFFVNGTILLPSPLKAVSFSVQSGLKAQSNRHVLQLVSPKLIVNNEHISFAIPLPLECDGKIYGIDLGNSAQVDEFHITESGI